MTKATKGVRLGFFGDRGQTTALRNRGPLLSCTLAALTYSLASGGTNSTATWHPSLTAGNYKVYARWISNRSNSTQVPYTIQHSNQTNTVYVDQTLNNATWVLLGTFNFDGSGAENIIVSDSNGRTVVDGIQLLQQPVSYIETQLQYIHNDHLATPQRMTNETGQVIWEAHYETFGKAQVNIDVDGDGKTAMLNLRFPGQYFDVETGLHYNYFRDYDPTTGRYVQSDPIGLKGGINTYGYVSNNPLMLIDPLGLYGTSSCGNCREKFFHNSSFCSWFCSWRFRRVDGFFYI